MSDPKKRGLTLEERQPDYEDLDKRPKTLTRSRHIDDIMYVAGRAPVTDKTQYDIMFVTVSVEEEEAATQAQSTFGFRVNQPAEYLKGANGVIKDVAMRVGVDLDRCYYTACCKWLLPRTQRARPSKKIMKWGIPMLEDEIKRVDPKIIVCLGKHVFDMIGPQKINFKDAHGCWFWSEEHEAHMYVMHTPYTLVGKPELYETFRIDFKEIARRKELLDTGAKIIGRGFDHQIIRSQEELLDWVDRLEELHETTWPGHVNEHGCPLLGVDCEWHGRTHIDGNLRTIQIAWSETEAVVIEFRDENNRFTFDLAEDPEGDTPEEVERGKYAAIGKVLSSVFTRIDARYIGHHFSADAVWMEHWLGIDTYRKCEMDTEFAQQTVDESSELGLERGIAMKYTNLGRYDQALVMWKRENKKLCEGGYGYIPSAILHPYGAADVITPLRAYPLIKRQLEAQKLWEYYRDIFNPFVTDVFTEFCMVGLPMDLPMMDDLRELFTFTVGKLKAQLQKRISAEATDKLRSKIITEFGLPALMKVRALIDDRNEDELKNTIKQWLADEDNLAEIPTWNKWLAHWAESPNFNIRSSDQMSRWLFDFEGLTPIKTTNQKAKGLPSMAWEQVMKLPKDKQALYKPAVDKQTLAILSEQLPAIDELLDLNAVGNLSKAFFKEPDIFEDPNTGEEVREEHGLHAWLASDTRVHGMMSTTETGRPRSWCPNTLNWPSYVNKRISRSVEKCLREADNDGTLPDHLLKWVGHEADELPSIRSCVKAPDGWGMVESDYATAEMVGLSEIAMDRALRRILQEPDPDWVKLKPENQQGLKVVRVGFTEPLKGFPIDQRPEFIMSAWEDGVNKGPVTDDMLMRDADGNLIHAKYDIHWSLAEMVNGLCREAMVAKVNRNAAKVINFCCDGDALVDTRDRGAVALKSIKPDDLLWDGAEWVSHEGVFYTGRKEVIEYQGLWATREHEVWTVEAGKVHLGEAVEQSLTLLRANPSGAEGNSDAAAINPRKRYAETYDILNAGPRHRFTCGGVLVSNSSAYGASAGSLERKIESDTGVKPDEGTGERGLEAIAARQPRATQFLEEMARVPKEKGFYRAASGRIRHCLTHGSGSGVGWRTRSSIESALGREMRNFPMQESVGATSARACIWLLHAYRKLGLKARVMTCLYDSVVTLCPLEERFLVARLHDIFMSEINTWDYDDEHGKRTLQYTIDNEFNYRWSTTPSKEELALLDSRDNWSPPPKYEMLEKHPNLRSLAR